MTLFDLNKIPDDMEENMEEEVTTPRPSNALNTGALDISLLGPWRIMSPSEVAALYNRVQLPANPHGVGQPAVTRHAEGSTAVHGWMQRLAPAVLRPGGTMVHSSEWLTRPSIFHPLAAAPNRQPPAVRAATDVASAFSNPRQQGSHGAGLQQQVASQTTTESVDETEHNGSSQPSETNGGSQGSGSNGGTDELSALEIHRKAIREGKRPMKEVELKSSITWTDEHGSIDSPPSTPTPALLPHAHAEHIGSSAQQRGENQPESEHPNAENMEAELLKHLAREAAFRAEFDFATLRCNSRKPCRRCLPFWKLASGAEHLRESSASSSGGAAASKRDQPEDLPPVLQNAVVESPEAAAPKRRIRHGPKSKSSQYRGVTFYKRTGRWESHIWHRSRQVYLGASATKEEAARAYDKAALLFQGSGADINFLAENYQHECNYLYKLNKAQLTIYLRRDSRGFGAELGHVGVKRLKNKYEASIPVKTVCDNCPETTKKEVLGIFATEEEAARCVYSAALKKKCKKLVRKIINTHHVMGMVSYITQWYAAVAPEEMEDLIRIQKQTKASKKGKSSSSTKKAKKAKKGSPDSSTQINVESSSSTPPGATAPSDESEEHELPPLQIHEPECGCPGAPKRKGHNLTSKKAPKQRQTCSTGAGSVNSGNPPPPLPAAPPSRGTRKARSPRKNIGVSGISSSSATVVSGFSGIGQASTPPSVPPCSVSLPPLTQLGPVTSDSTAIRIPPGVIKFKLFNVEINVAEVDGGLGGHGGHGRLGALGGPGAPQSPNGVGGGEGVYTPLVVVTQEKRLDKLMLPRKMCKTTGRWRSYLPHALAKQMASGLNNVVAINKRLHEILAESSQTLP